MPNNDLNILIAGWFSFEQMGASAGDLLARDLTAQWLANAGVNYTTAVDKPFTDGVHWSSLDPDHYTHVVFVCGPCGNGPPLTELLDRFVNCKWVGLNLTMLQNLDEWNPFELLIERDSNMATRADMVFLTQPLRVPKVGLILVHPQKEYGDRGRHEQVSQLISDVLSSIDVAVVPIDTRLDENATGLRSSGQIETMIAAMDLTITTRLHGTVLSLKNDTPPIVIDPIAGGAKVATQCDQIGWRWCRRAENLTGQWLREGIDYALTHQAVADVKAYRESARESLSGIESKLIEHLRAAYSAAQASETR